MYEKRIAPRKRSLLTGRVLIGTALVYDCTIRDISDTGAKLAFPTPTTLPDEFRLLIPQQQRSLWVHVAWRRGTALGVQFMDVGAPPKVA